MDIPVSDHNIRQHDRREHLCKQILFQNDFFSFRSRVHTETVWHSGGNGHHARLSRVRHTGSLQDLQPVRKVNSLPDEIRSTTGFSNRAADQTHISRKVR